MRSLSRERGRGRGRAARVGALVLAASCAGNRSAPPGGPEDRLPPQLVRVTPESGSTAQRPGTVEFVFDETVSDRPAQGDLHQYFLISPWDGEPRIDWHRSRIRVRPRRNFRPNTAYTVTLLPGLADIRGNTMTQGAAVAFSTGATFPGFGIVGRIFDWAAERPAAAALIQAISRPDSVVYLAASDSSGQFSIGPFGAGRYTLIGIVDRNNNRALDPGEAWDSVSVLITVSRPIEELLAIVRDTIPPRITNVAREDSATVRVTFDRPLDPGQPLTPARFRLQRADSTELPIAAVLGGRDTSARAPGGIAPPPQRRDTAARTDTAGAARPVGPPSVVPLPLPVPRPPPAAERPAAVTPPPPPKPPRPPPETSVLLKLAPPAVLEPGATYRVTARDVRGLLGRPATTARTLTVPRAQPSPARDSAAVPRRRPPDRPLPTSRTGGLYR